MKREDIYIEVTPDTIGAYVAVLEKHSEKIGSLEIRDGYSCLMCNSAGWWFVGGASLDRIPLYITDVGLDQWLTELKAAESKDVHAEPSEPDEIDIQLYAYQCGAFEPVTLCDDLAVVRKENGEKLIISRKQLYVGNLTPLMP